jgi:hypothetical protein
VDVCKDFSFVCVPSPGDENCIITSLISGASQNDNPQASIAPMDLRLALFDRVLSAQKGGSPVTISAADNESFRNAGIDGERDHVMAAADMFETPFVSIQTDDDSLDPVEPIIHFIEPSGYPTMLGTDATPVCLALLLHNGRHYNAAYLEYSCADASQSPFFSLDSLRRHLQRTLIATTPSAGADLAA